MQSLQHFGLECEHDFFGEKTLIEEVLFSLVVAAECLKWQVQCTRFPSTKSTERSRVFHWMHILWFVLNLSTKTLKRLLKYFVGFYCQIEDWFIPFEVQANTNANKVVAEWNTNANVVVAEWLRRQIRNLLGNYRAGSNPGDYGKANFQYFFLECSYLAKFSCYSMH